jgi:hypothetical protein
MKQFLVELDDRSARDLERVAPAKERKRTEFVRLAIRSAIDRALDRSTAQAYRSSPLSGELTSSDLAGWDAGNELAKTPGKPRSPRTRRSGAKKTS